MEPCRARTSPLLWRLFGRNTSRAWDRKGRPGQPLPPMPPPGADPLTDEEKRAFVEWIDLGAHWDGIPDADAVAARERSGIQSGGSQ